MEDTKSRTLKELMNSNIKDIIKLNRNSKVKRKKNKKKNASGLKKNIVSFDINEEFINIVVGKYYKDELTIVNCIEINTPSNTVEDGKIINEVLLIEELSKVLVQNKIKAKYGSFTTNSTLIINREMIIPKIEEDEMDTVISHEISKYLPINLNDYIIQILIIDELKVDGIEKLKVQAICYPQKVAKSYYDILMGLNLKPYSLDIKFNSLSKVINYSQEINEDEYEINDSNVFIEIGPVSTDISIYKRGKIDFTRIIKLGYKNIENYGLNRDINIGVDYLIEEIERIFLFYKNKSRGNRIDKVYLFGEGARVKGLDTYMSKTFQRPVETIENIGFVEFTSKSDNEYPLHKYLNAMGSIIRL